MWQKIETIIINNRTALILIIAGMAITIFFTFVGNFIRCSGTFNPQMFSYYGSFVGGILGPILSLSGFIIIYLSFKAQSNQHSANLRVQNRQHFENLLFKQIESLNNYRVYNPEENDFTTYMCFFKDFYSKVLEGDNSLLGTYENDGNNDFTFKMEFEKYNSFIHDYIRRLNSIIEFIQSSPEVDNDRYISILFNQLSIFEIFYLKTMTIRMLETGVIDINGIPRKIEDLRNRLYPFLVDNKLIHETLKKDDKTYYPCYIKILKDIKIEIPNTKK